MMVLCEILGTLAEILMPLFLAICVDGVVRGEPSTVLAGCIALGLAVGLNMLLMVAGIQSRLGLVEKVGHWFDHQVLVLSSRITDVEVLESDCFQDRMQQLRDNQGSLGKAFSTIVVSLNQALMPIGTAVLVIFIDARLLLLLPLALPVAWAAVVSARWDERAENDSAPFGRFSEIFLERATSPSSVNELLVMGGRKNLLMHVATTAKMWRQPIARAEGRSGFLNAATAIIYFGGAGTILYWIARDVASGLSSVGVLAAGLLVTTLLQDAVSMIRFALRSLGATVRNVRRFAWLSELATSVPPPTSVGDPDSGVGDIELNNVSFIYPGNAVPAIEGLTLTLDPGTVVALVGENGSGKSTLIKLLSGIYGPTTGTLTVAGCQISGFDRRRWQNQVTASFQDSYRFEIQAQDFVGLGSPQDMHNQARMDAAADAGDATSVIAKLPQKWSTQLGSTWPGGVDLSAGQWQRLSVSQAMMKASPRLVILDEPTATLDADSEHRLLQRYARIAKTNASSGCITVIVTHRFSTVRFADRIIVLERGRLVEDGTHAELLEHPQLYSKLYAEQSIGYAMD